MNGYYDVQHLNAESKSASHTFSKSDISFVDQEDAFFSMLTVNETLTLARSLKILAAKNNIVKNMDDSFQDKDPNFILNKLNLIGVADSKIGDINEKGISGGERKRLSVAIQFLGNPRFLVADEPTSGCETFLFLKPLINFYFIMRFEFNFPGLDSFQATQVVQLLKNIATEKQMATICTIHQPSSLIWGLFDDILLLTPTGEIAYHGERKDSISYFSSIGYICPQHYNPAEFLIDLVSIDSSSVQKKEASIQRIQSIVSQFNKYIENKNTLEKSGGSSSRTHKSVAKKDVNIFPAPKYFNLLLHPFHAIRKSSSRFFLLFWRASQQVLRLYL
jgi:ABC-type multidrug transport system ATPase subunit